MTSDQDTRTLALRSGDVATLVRHPAADGNTRGAVLYVHGFVDYFFQDHVAGHFAKRGYDFYALDLRRYGRSLRDGDVPYFVDDITTYYEELDAAMEAIRADGHDRVVVFAHSAGGLITPLWLHDRRPAGVTALVLNSPWLELAENRFRRTVVTWAIRGLGRVRPFLVLPEKLGAVYPESIHRDHRGEWAFDTAWKPVAEVPIHAGWLRAIRRAHARLHRGLEVGVPVLVMHSDRSLLHQDAWSPAAMATDTVLDVADMERWAPALGRNVTTVTIPGGMHDLFLSAEPVRAHAFAVMDDWLDRVTG
jgi:alpha-beta hydrolase superfamily lysophospholipase